MNLSPDRTRMILGERPCTWCNGTGKCFGRKPCSLCKGTRRGPRGGKNKCRCFDGTEIDKANLVECGAECNNTGHVPETVTDSIPAEVWAEWLGSVPIEVRTHDPEQTVVERVLGFGILSVTDYGRGWDARKIDLAASNAAMIGELRAHTSNQLCKVAHKSPEPDGSYRLADRIIITVHRGGYTAFAVMAVEPVPAGGVE